MHCLHCGDCCRRMSPLSQPDPCPRLAKVGTFYLCGRYAERPEECRDHEYSFARFCPVGMEVLGLRDSEDLRRRIDEGWRLTTVEAQ